MPGTILPFNGIWPRVDDDAFIAETAIVIGDVEIGPGSSVWYGCVVRGDVNRIRIGARTNIQDGTVIHVAHDPAGDYRETGGGTATEIGDDITVGHMALIHAATLQSGCFVGMRATVMDTATVAAGGMVAAGALVTPGKTVGDGELWSGVPARKARALSEEERENIAYSARQYVRLAEAYHRRRHM